MIIKINGDYFCKFYPKYIFSTMLCKRGIILWYDIFVNPLTPNDHYRGRTVLTNRRSYEPIHGRTTYQPVLTTFLQPRHIPTQGYNIPQSSAPDDGHMVARNMLSNY